MSHKLTVKELDALRNGYEENAALNEELAQIGIDADNEALQSYEEYLTRECE